MVALEAAHSLYGPQIVLRVEQIRRVRFYSLMPQSQLLLFPDPRPLVERLGVAFFREAPEKPGVYLMRDAAGTVLYVGKAVNLRRRLGSYRVANPDRMPTRQLRLLRAVERIEFEECEDEDAALAVEARLLRSLRPRFNRAGTWGGLPSFVVWRATGRLLEFAVADAIAPGWRSLGSCFGAWRVRNALVRLVWLAVDSERSFAQLPQGWIRAGLKGERQIDCGSQVAAISEMLEGLGAGRLPEVSGNMGLFDGTALEADLETLRQGLASLRAARRCAN
jgi:hypothetical protein